jgi:hypothetical protein
MADWEAYTSSNGVRVTDEAAVRALLGRYYLDVPGEIWRGVLSFRSDDSFFEVSIDDKGLEICTTEFLHALRPFLIRGDYLCIQSIGHEGSDWPFSAWSCIVTKDKVLEYTLPTDTEDQTLLHSRLGLLPNS